MGITVKEVCEHTKSSRVRVVGCYDGRVIASTKKTAVEKHGDKNVEYFETRITEKSKYDHTCVVSELVLWVSNYEEGLRRKLKMLGERKE